MAFTKLLRSSLFFYLLLSLIFTKIDAQVVNVDNTAGNDFVSEASVSGSSLRLELDHLNSKISSLESSIDERTCELQTKSEHIKQLEKTIEEKSNSLASLEKEIKSFKEKGSLDAKQQIDKASARANELEKQINNLKKEIEGKQQKKDAFETRASLAEKKIQELNLKLESLQKISEEQKSSIHKTERALQAAEEEMVKAKAEAALLSKRLSEVHGAWLPPWLALHYIHYQSVIVNNWNTHGRPALDLTIQKALEKKARIQKFVQPHIDTFKTKWIPIIKERSSAFASDIGPHVKSLSAKATDLYYASKNAAEAHIMKAQEVIDPYYQEAKKFTKPYVDQVSLAMKPHVEKARIFLRPYTKKMLRTFKKYVKKAAVYHRQVGSTIHKTLKKHEITKSLATKEFVWYMASAVMALPVIFFLNMVSGCFRKRPKKRTRNSSTSHSRHRGKRVHPDK